ncbi:MAG: Transcription termination protein NusA [Firmicutes bacterium]|nr:Transcription termination protein NusA [Bacillota bacterium]MDI6704717.1 transcription termination factor NusA [Bacillota bacterium]
MNLEFIQALEQIEKEKGISKDVLIEAINAALISAYKKNYGTSQNVNVIVDNKTGDVKVFSKKEVVEHPENVLTDISLEEAKRISPKYELGDNVEIEVTPKNFGRIAAQTAKQVVVQRIREAERGIIYDEFINRENELVNGMVQRWEKNNVMIDLGRIEAVLPPAEQIPAEDYNAGSRIKVYIVEVKKTTKGPQIVVSRTHPGLVKRLFELEVPEIHDGIVQIKGISREAGARTKIAVNSVDPNVDPVGACVGPKGVRVQAVVNELRGEKIDIIKWSADVKEFIANSLSPAKVVKVSVSESDKSAKVVVKDYQLSLAIGKEGQNARLAAKITGWKIDIKSESQVQDGSELTDIEDEHALGEEE